MWYSWVAIATRSGGRSPSLRQSRQPRSRSPKPSEQKVAKKQDYKCPKGFATIVLLDGAPRPLLTVLRWGTGGFFNPFNRPVRLVTLAPGGNAYMAMGWSHIPAPGQTCPLAPNLLLLPPPASSALLVAVGHGSVPAYGPVDACGGQLTVSAVESTPFLL